MLGSPPETRGHQLDGCCLCAFLCAFCVEVYSISHPLDFGLLSGAIHCPKMFVVEQIPEHLVPSADVGGMVRGVGNLTKDALTFKWAQASMKDVAVNAVVVTEIACWFFIGECIGKGSLVGYQV